MMNSKVVIMNEAFVYIWRDKVGPRFYIGKHKGTVDDGYVCSSKFMLPEYQERPQDFSRRILAWGSDEEMMSLEERLLTLRKEHFGVRYYNRMVSYGNFGVSGELNGSYKDGRSSNPEYGKEYYVANKDKIAAYYAANRDELSKQQREYRLKNKDEINRKWRERYHKNKQLKRKFKR